MSAEQTTKDKKIDLFLIQAVVLLDRQFVLLDRLVRTSQAIPDYESAIERKEQALEHVLDIYNYVLALIDHLVRYQKIVFSIPRLSSKSKEHCALNEALGNLKDVRDQLQHINNDIENDYTGPLLGAVSWVSLCGKKNYLAMFNDMGRDRSSPSLVFDTQEGKYVQNFSFIYNGQYYDLGKAIEGVKKFHVYIKSLVQINVDGKPYETENHYAALCIQIVPSLESLAEQ